MFRIGNGFDVHPLSEGRQLVIGGVIISHSKGLVGHSDADVLVHAIMDALLGAVGEGDIGLHFPDGDSKYENANSISLLKELYSSAIFAKWRICNIDSVILAEKPKFSPYFPNIRKNISLALGIPDILVSVKATTTEKLGFIGREEGIAASAVALLKYRQNP